MDCYGFNSTYVLPNSNKCATNGMCCASTDTCTSQRLCQRSDGQLIRGSCYQAPWDNSTCAQICLYDEVNLVFPRVKICTDGSYCCNNDPACCAMKRGVFLSPDGQVISTTSTSSTTTSTTSSSTSIGSSTFTPTPTPTVYVISSEMSSSTLATQTSFNSPINTSNSYSPVGSGASKQSTGLSTSAKIVIGIAVPVVVLIGLLLWFFIRRYRKRIQELESNESSKQENKPAEYSYNHGYPIASDNNMSKTDITHFAYAQTPPEHLNTYTSPSQHNYPPSELDTNQKATHDPTELDASDNHGRNNEVYGAVSELPASPTVRK